MKIIADEVLFNRWDLLSWKVKMISTLVQNDLELTNEEIQEWKAHALAIKGNLEKLVADTLGHIDFCNKDEK